MQPYFHGFPAPLTEHSHTRWYSVKIRLYYRSFTVVLRSVLLYAVNGLYTVPFRSTWVVCLSNFCVHLSPSKRRWVVDQQKTRLNMWKGHEGRNANVEYEWRSWKCDWIDLLTSPLQIDRVHFVFHSLIRSRFDLSIIGREMIHRKRNKTALHPSLSVVWWQWSSTLVSNPNTRILSGDTSTRRSNWTSISVWCWLLSWSSFFLWAIFAQSWRRADLCWCTDDL
jgi:hypothetical protein